MHLDLILVSVSFEYLKSPRSEHGNRLLGENVLVQVLSMSWKQSALIWLSESFIHRQSVS